MVRIQKINLLFVLLLSVIFAHAQSQESFYDGGIYYKYKDNNKTSLKVCAVPTGVDPYTGTINIPANATVENNVLPVVAIDGSAFMNGTDLTISIPSSIKEIGANAFLSCTITSVTYASIDHMQEIDYGSGTSNPMVDAVKVFAGKEELQDKEITINSQNVKPRVFKGAKWLKRVNIGSEVKTIGDDAFYGTMIESITLPSTLTSVGNSVFKYCINLQTVTIEASLDGALTNQMFLGCSSLTSVTLNAATTATGTSTFYECSSLTSLPQGLKTIGESAFGKCTGFVTLEIPATITSIGTKAFEGCNKIEDIVIAARLGSNPLSIGSKAFNGLSRLKNIYSHAQNAPTVVSDSYDFNSTVKLYLPSGATGYASSWEVFGFNIINYEDTHRNLTYKWGNSENEQDVVNGIEVGAKIFENIPEEKRTPSKGEGWTFIGWKDDEGHDVSANTTMPPLDLTIYAYFQKADAVDNNHHYKCDLLYSPTISTAKIKGFADNYAPTSIVLPQEVTVDVDYKIIAIEDNAFKGKTSLQEVDLSEAANLISIGNGVFEGCTSLVSVDLGSNLTTIPNRAFYGCTNLASFTLPTTIETIGVDAFNQCDSLKELPWGTTDFHLQTIKANAFKNCKYLKAIILPSTFQRLENNAFYGCNNIRTITINSSVPEVDETPFNFQDFKDVYLFVKAEYKEAYNTDDYWKQFTINPEAKKLTYILDGNQEPPYHQDNITPGTKITRKASPSPEFDNRPFDGWHGEPEIMPNEDVVVTGSLQYKITYMAEGTSDKLISEPSAYFTGSAITTPVDQLKKTGLTYVIVNPVETMSAKDTTIYVKYSLTTAPTPSSGLIYNNADQELINKVNEHAGTLKYSLDKITFSEAKPTGKDAKTYKVYYRVDGITSHYNSALDSLEVTIAPKTVDKLTITLKENEKGYTYNENQHKPDVVSVSTKINNVDTAIPKEEYKVSYGNNVNAGTEAKVYIEDNKENGNYIIKKDSTTFEIKPAKGKLSDLLTETGKPTAINNLGYTGAAQNLIKGGTINEAKSKNGKLKYSLNNIDFDIAIPQGKDAKEYTVYYKVEDDPNYTPSDTAQFNVTIKAKEITISKDNITLEKDSYTYDGTAKKPVVTIKVGGTTIPAEECNVSYTDSINAGTATVTITEKKGGNYKFKSVSKTYKITPKAGSLAELIDKDPQAAGDNITYNTNPQNLIKTGTGTLKKGISGSLKYSLDKKTFKTDIPTGTDAKEYTVYYMAEGDPNYTPSDTLSLKVNILPRTASVTNITLKENSYTYDGKAKEPGIESVSVSFNTSAGTKTINIVNDKKEYKVSYTNNINATNKDSKAQVMIIDSIGGNYSFDSKSTTFEITRAKGRLDNLLTQKPTGIDKLSYTGEAQNLIQAGKVNEGKSKDGKLKYSLDNKVFVTDIPQGTKAQVYTIYYKVEDDPNYTPSDTASIKVTIKAKEMTISADNISLEKDSYTYDGTAKKPVVTVKTGGTTIPAEEYTVSYADSINAGTATITVTAKKDGNYKFDSVNKTYKITPAASSLTNAPTTKTNIVYNGTAQELINKDGKTSTGTLEYSLSLDKANFKETIPTGTDAKTYTVYYRVKGDANHSDSEIGFVKATIAPKEINTFSLSQSSYTYAGNEIKPDVIVEFNKQAISKDEYTVSYSNNKDAGTATVIVTDKEGGNFTVSGRKTFTIAKAPLTISADSYEIFEGEKIPEFTAKYNGFVKNETQAVLTSKPILSCNATATSKPGDYTISVGGAKAANYNITFKSGKLTILALKFVSGGESSKDEDDPATYKITSIGKDVGTTPTVAIVDDKDVGGAFAIPEAVTYHNTNYKVTEINESAFENNKYLTEVSIPSSITSIGDKAFKGCSNLKSITVYVTTPISLAVAGTRGEETSSGGASVFEGVDKTTCILYVPEASVDLYKAAPVWKDFQHILPISGATGIIDVNVTEGEPFDVYNLQGRKVRSRATDLRGLPRGVYIINGKKVAVK